MVGVLGVGVVGTDQEGLGQQPVFIQGKGLGNPGDGLAQQGGACTLGVDRSALSRMLSQLQAQGVLRYRKNHFELLGGG